MQKTPFLACAILASLTAGSLPAGGATFDVSYNRWGTSSTPNSWAWAIHQANITAGHDTINVLSDVNIGDYEPTPSQPFELAVITDPAGLTIQGNGRSLVGDPSYINTLGQLITKHDPRKISIGSGDILVGSTFHFARIADNVNNVVINDLIADGLNQFLAIGKGSTVTVRGTTIRNAGYFGQHPSPTFSVFDDSTLNLESLYMKDIDRFDSPIFGYEWSWNAIIAGHQCHAEYDQQPPRPLHVIHEWRPALDWRHSQCGLLHH
ncbi:MAG: hypothetical protein ACKOZW_06280 [Cyanobium sp.]